MANFECTPYDPKHWWTEKQDLNFSKIVSSLYYLEGDQHYFFYLGFLLKYSSFLLPFSVRMSVLFRMPELETSGCRSSVRSFSSCHAPWTLVSWGSRPSPEGSSEMSVAWEVPPVTEKLWGFALQLAATILLASFPFQKHLHCSHVDPQSWCRMLWHQPQNWCWWYQQYEIQCVAIDLCLNLCSNCFYLLFHCLDIKRKPVPHKIASNYC